MQALTPILQETFGQVSALPVVLGLLGGQPMPFYLGPQDVSRVDPLLDSFLEAAVTNAVTGRVDVSGALPGAAGAEAPLEEDEDGLSAEHQAAYDAIEQGDWDAAVAAYERALAADPGDELARLGLGQVTLLRRTSKLDLAAVRKAAAERPDDVQAQIEAADVDVVGGHVEDAFLRLVDTVRRTTGAERDAARTHLLGLFEVVGPADPRVVKGRSALMSALF
jgi:putative thioredoxin